MLVSGIQRTLYQERESQVGKVSGNDSASFGGLVKEAAQTASVEEVQTLHGDDEETGDIAVYSNIDFVNGKSITVYKPKDFDSDNPVYKVKMWDASGNVTEEMVDVSKVNPKNSDTIEMYAYCANLKENGQGNFVDTVLKAAVAKAVKNAENKSVSWNFAEKMDWVEIANEIMESSYRYGDIKGYMGWKKFVDLLE